MSTVARRERWTYSNKDELYATFFTPLLTDSCIEYLNALYENELYERLYIETYCEAATSVCQNSATPEPAVANHSQPRM